jgi:eukaryotic-like serine/threonine-protein kinase
VTEHWLTRAHALFERAIDLDEASRRALLDRECGDAPQLRRRVEAMLESDDRRHALLDAEPLALWTALVADEPPEHLEIGPWRVVRELGRGGMGVVYLAERTDPELRQLAALKIVAPRPDAHALAERFRRERQILANLRHANIAQLWDGGVTPEGLPWLAMEYVDGQRIDRWCDVRSLEIEARLRLFVTVCRAVQHAQQNLVVHRDLKPANVLVTDDGVVKLLDFGIAKLLAEGEPDDPDPGHTVVQALTPRYASPEQIRSGPVSTATDVHALGVLLYELVTGVPPWPERDDPFETARDVLEREPQPASDAVRRGGSAAAATRAELRGLSPEQLARRVRGDLDVILARALKKDPAERYPSAAALADDLDRHLRHEPIEARAAGTLYRFRKFVRRRRGPVAAGLLLAGLSGAFTVVHTVRIEQERARAELEAEKASATRDFLLGLFTSAQPHETLGEELTLGDLLERGVVRTDSLERPELRALLLTTLGDVYRVLGRYDRAGPLVQRSVDEYRALGDQDLGLADALLSQAVLAWDLDDLEGAATPMRESLAIQRRLLDEDDPRVLTSLSNLATLEGNLGDSEAALRAHMELLDRRRRILGAEDPAVALTLNNIGTIHYRADRLDEAERWLREALEHRRRTLPPEHPDVALSLNNLASVLRDRGATAEAEALFREALELRLQTLGPDHPSVAVSHYNLARSLRAAGVLDSAEVHFRAALEIDRRAYGPDHSEVGVDAFQLGQLLVEKGDCVAADEAFAEAVRVFELNDRADRVEQASNARAQCQR